MSVLKVYPPNTLNIDSFIKKKKIDKEMDSNS